MSIDTRDRILSAALACIDTDGLAATSVEDIARAASVGRATIYRHFPGGREQIISETITWEVGRFFAGIEQSIADAPDLAAKIDADFGSFDAFKEQFKTAGATQFGSGWAWLVEKDGKLSIISTPNQDPPLLEGKTALLGIDVWEHAYYLKYQNKRADYLAAWWNLVNWKAVSDRFGAAISKS